MSVCSKNQLLINKTDKRIDNGYSYFVRDCATARRVPNKEYFELVAHPDHRTEYTERLDVAKINRMPKFRLISVWGIGNGIHRLKASVSLKSWCNNKQ